MEGFLNHGDEPHGDIVDCEFLVAGAQTAILLVPAHHSLHDVPPLVGLLVEPLVAGLILSRRDHLRDSTVLAPPPDARVAVALVRRQAARPVPLAGAAVEQSPGHGRLEELALMALPRRDVDGHDETVALTNQVDLRAEATTRTPERMVRRLLELRLLTPAQPSRAVRLFFSPRRQLDSPG
jgi:hypothetical protein